MSRATSLMILGKRRHYAGFDYAECRLRTMTGSAWQQLALGGRVEDNGDCLAVYDGASLRFEIYTRSLEHEAAEREAAA